jgi:AraC-like DNA-binding protein
MRDACGVTPKRLASVLRFERAVRLARSRTSRSWSQIAAECGYADHAHLTREFQRFAGESPSAWALRGSLVIASAESI